MQPLVTFLTVIGGLALSIAVAVVVEEFIFGEIFKAFFAKPSPAPAVLTKWTAQPVELREPRRSR